MNDQDRDLAVPVAWLIPKDRQARRLIRPFAAKRGQQHQCPECEETLTIRKAQLDADGNVLVRKHFAHRADTMCTGGKGEGARHRNAKKIVAQMMTEWMTGAGSAPALQFRCDSCGSIKAVPVSAVNEVHTEYGLRGYVADVCVRQGAHEGAIEIRDTSPMDAAKVLAFSGESGIAWWAEIDAAAVVEDGELRVHRASWRPLCLSARCRLTTTSTPNGAPDAGMLARRSLSALPMETRLGDVCPACGQHMIADEIERLRFFVDGGSATCRRCGISKSRGASDEQRRIDNDLASLHGAFARGWEVCPGCGRKSMQYGHCVLPGIGCGATKLSSMPCAVQVRASGS